MFPLEQGPLGPNGPVQATLGLLDMPVQPPSILNMSLIFDLHDLDGLGN